MSIFLSFNLGESCLADPEPQNNPNNNNNNCPNAPELRGLDTYSLRNITFQCIESDIKKKNTQKYINMKYLQLVFFCVP